MKRRNFIKGSLLAAPIVGLAPLVGQAKDNPATVSFTVKSGKDRFNEPIMFRGVNPNLVKISGKDTAGQLAVFEYEGLAKMGPTLHVHFKQDETFYVVEGDYLFQVGEKRQTLKAGDTIFLPRNIHHTWLQLSERGKLLYMLHPAGKMEEFFKKMDSLKGIPSEAERSKIHADHDMKVVGPPLAL